MLQNITNDSVLALLGAHPQNQGSIRHVTHAQETTQNPGLVTALLCVFFVRVCASVCNKPADTVEQPRRAVSLGKSTGELKWSFSRPVTRNFTLI